MLKESLLMAMCIRDMMQGNAKLAEKGLVEESLGYNARTPFQSKELLSSASAVSPLGY
jgi:hypothetical protein